MPFTMIVSWFEKSHCLLKIVSSFALTAKPHQNIGDRSDYQINDTDKRAIPTYNLLNHVSLL